MLRRTQYSRGNNIIIAGKGISVMRNAFGMIVALSLCAAGVAFAAGKDKVVERTVAVVNGDAIMYSEFSKLITPALEQYKQAVPEAEQSPEKIKEFKTKLLDQMVDDRILKQEAAKKKIRVAKHEVEKGIDQVKKRFPTEAEFQAELKKEDITLAQFEARIEDQLKVMKLIEQEVKAKIEAPSDKEVQGYFDQVQQKMAGKNLGLSSDDEEEIGKLAKYLNRMSSEQVRARHILVQVPKDASMEVKSAALRRIKQAQAELKKGADFGEMAKKYSDDPGSKSRGGDLGLFAKGDMVPEFEKTAFSLNVGEISEPVLTDFGYHLIRVEEKRASKKINFEDIKADLKELLAQKAAQQRYESWVKDLKAKSSITINALD